MAVVTPPPGVDWSDWTVIILKPDCLARGLREPVLVWVQREVQVVDVRTVWPTEAQIFVHYSDMLPLSAKIGRDVPAELRRIFVGQPTGLALAYGPNAAPRLRERLGPTDPATAPADTIRGRFGIDSLRAAMAEGRLVDNLIHSSDTVEVVPRDFGIWYGPGAAHLLRAPATPSGGTR
ncbi:nucleoside-diphosphate kinase [Micromonospora sp. WMMA1363]|nr:nucleoside-diphosphate kinase [Micromonospora sp. WMMA1363]MDM4721380.1 nucleoside-diphosphate kinase [Micromonospora sp. WMMA1363]